MDSFSKKKIILVCEAFRRNASGGLVAMHTAQMLVDTGVSVTVVCAEQYSQRDDPLFASIRFCSLPKVTRSFHRGSWSLGFRRWCRDLYDTESPDVVHFCSITGGKPPYMIDEALRRGIRVVAQPFTYEFFCRRVFAMLPSACSCVQCIEHGFYSAIANRCTSFIRGIVAAVFRKKLQKVLRSNVKFLSTCLAMDIVLKKYGILESNIVRMMIPFPRDRIRDPIVNEGRHFLFYGQWNPAKGSTLLPAIVKSCPDVPFLFYPNGTGAVHASAEMNEQSQPNLKIITGSGWDNGVFAALADSRAVILPTIWDVSFEYVLFESMGCGKSVIAFSAGAYADYLVHGENAMVVPTGDIEAFATAIHEVNNNAELRARLACGALKTFQKLTDTNAMLKALEKAYFG